MIYRPDNPEVMKSIAKLRSNRDFMIFIEFLDTCLDRTNQEMGRAIDEYKVRWFQGGAQDLHEILRLHEESKRL